MNARKILLITIFAVSPYIISNYAVFVYLIPLFYLFYGNADLKNTQLISIAFLPVLIVLFPIIAYNPATYIFGIVIASFFFAVFLVISKSLIRRFENTFLSICIPPIIWVGLIYLLNFKSLIASIFDLGVLFPMSAPVIWFLGSIGITFLIILFNAAIARYLAKKDRFSLILSCTLIIIFAGCFIFSSAQNPNTLHASDKPLKIALIQGDVPRDSIFGYKENLDKRIEKYIALSENALNEGRVDAIIWPEYTLPIDIMHEYPDKMKPILNAVRKANTPFLIGSLLKEKGKNYNTVLIFDRNANLNNIYYSQDPALFNKSVYAKENSGKIYIDSSGITLCWEEINTNVYRKYIMLGAQSFISLSSNTDLDYSWFKRYVSFFSRARAAENMRYLARCAQTGITQIISPYGKVVKSLPTSTSTYLKGSIFPISKKTFYSRYGDILTKLFIIFIILSSIISEVIRRQKAKGGLFV